MGNYIKPLIYFGLFGTLGGFAFWVALIWIDSFGKADAAVARISRYRRNTIDRYGNRAAIFPEFTEPRK